MKPEYDLSKAEKGKFYHPDAVLNVPLYLEPDVDQFVREFAERTGQDAEHLVNEWLRHTIQLIRSTQTADPVTGG
jgi:hypothetical protein